MDRSIEKLMSAILTLATVVVAVAIVHREFLRPVAPEQAAVRAPERITTQQWHSLLEASIAMGGDSANAPVVLVEFADLECPACGHYHEKIIPRVQGEFGANLSYRVIHLPLPAHRFARHAAIAAECAAGQGAFRGFVDEVFRKQDSIGLKSWTSYAHDAEVLDTTRFRQCIADPTPPARIDAGIAIAESLEVESTPTVIVNGWRYFAPPGATELSRVISDLLAGRKPFEANTRVSLRDLAPGR
jgi:protein-disulfide isomerase